MSCMSSRAALSRPRSLASLVVALVAVAACERRGADAAGPQPPEPTPVAAGPQTLQLDGARMSADIAFLASDDMHGRFTLSPDLRRAAEFLAQRHKELGLVPVGADYAVDFPLAVGARATRPAAMSLTRGTQVRPVADRDFSPLPQSASGTVSGPLVFVGYAARSEAEVGEDGKAQGTVAYDDLAGVDVKGKIALVLLEAPGRPDPMVLFTRLQAQARRFTEAAVPLKAARDEAGLRALHQRSRAELVALLAGFMPADRLGGVWPLPADVMTVEYDLQAIGGALMKEAASLPGPRFGFGEGSLKTKVERLAQAGAVGVIAVRGPRSFLGADERAADEFTPLMAAKGHKVGEPLALPVVQMKWKAADALLAPAKLKPSKLQAEIDGDRKPRSRAVAGVEVSLSVALEPVTTPVPNVLAALPGSDRAAEIVMIGAHYDHIGMAGEGEGECGEARSGEVVDAICNGADDNASGTAMLLELARAWKAGGRGPRRTIVFTHFAGEEMGILGSKALAEAPPFDLKRVVAMVNLDMIGRLGPKGLAIGGLGSSDAWLPLLDEIGPAGLDVLYEGSVATRSDHASFYRKDIPVLFFFTGTHADYHRPGDTVDKINLEGMLKIGQIVGGVMVALGDGRAVPWKPAGPGGGLASGLPGTDPKTVVKRVKAG